MRTPARPAATLALIAALLLGWCGGGKSAEQAPGTQMSYRAIAPDDGATPERVAAVLRRRLATAGVEGAKVSPRAGRIVISASDGDGATRATISALTAPGRLALYDWETRVLGPGGVPAPSDPRVTGGPMAGGSAPAVARAEARRRAAAHRSGAATVVRSEGCAGKRWFAIAGDPALTNGDVRSAAAIRDELAGEPAVAVEFSSRGQVAFQRLTRDVARRGALAARAAAGPVDANQHFVTSSTGASSRRRSSTSARSPTASTVPPARRSTAA